MTPPENAACPECGCVGGDECEHLNCPCWTPKNAACLPTEQVRALVRLLYPDHMTPTARRMFEAACHEVEDPPDEDKQQVAT